jgi:ABC-type transport system substrate-binding protein/class 3 adenylate cyclase/streptogramin lyase
MSATSLSDPRWVTRSEFRGGRSTLHPSERGPITGDPTDGQSQDTDVVISGGPDQAADVRTFLIADVRGYTKYTQEHGDHAAAWLASAFAGLVREVVEAHQGFLLELRGDEALVVFVSARQALRAAVELQQRFERAKLPRGVGIGLDSGEAVPVGEGYRGGALNLAARLCSQARAGEVLASEAVIHLAAKIEGVAYVEPRMLRLKGYAEPIRALEVVPAGRSRKHALRRRIGRRTQRAFQHRGLRVALPAVVVVLALLALVLPRTLTGGGGPTSPLLTDPAGMALLDAKTGTQLGFVSASAVKSPVGMIYADGNFWVLNIDPVSFVEVQPKSGRVLRQIASPVGDHVSDYTVQGNDLWVTDGGSPALVQVDIRLGREVNRFKLYGDPNFPGGLGAVLAADGSVWVHGDGETLRIDPTTGRVRARIKDPPFFNLAAFAYGDGSIWSNGSPDGGVMRIDPASDTVAITGRVSATGNVAAGGGYAWTADEIKGAVYKVDRLGHVVASYPTGEGAKAVSFADGLLWVGNQDAGTVSGIDAVTGRRTTYRFEHPVGTIAAGSGRLLVALSAGLTYEDRIDALKGKVARLFVQAYQLDGDPASTWSNVGFEVEYATCAKLLNYDDKAAPAGRTIRPEIATSLPAVSLDGRTYTFTIRPGYRFSPPSNQPVTAETFRYSIERALSPKMAPGYWGPGITAAGLYVTDLEGEQAFQAGKADHISGLKAQGDTLTITMTRRSPDVLAQMAMPFFCPVPTDTPVVPQGAVTQRGGVTSVSSAGPYYIADKLDGEYTILKRNPRYSGPRPHALDAIALREGVDPGQAVARVQNGAWDGITNVGDSVMNPEGPLAKAWGQGGTSASKDGQRYYPAVPDGYVYLLLNAGRPLFADRRVRQAVAYALDRRALALDQGGALPTDQLVPPDQLTPSSEGAFPPGAPDLPRARELMHGVTGTAVLPVSAGCDECLQVPLGIKADLAAIGIAVRIKEVESSIDAIQQPGAPYDLKLAFTGGVKPLDSTAYLLGTLGPNPPPSWFSPMVRTLASRLREAPNETAAFAIINGPLMREVPYIGVAYSVSGAFFSPRVGCRLFPPASYGIDFAALCLAGSS